MSMKTVSLILMSDEFFQDPSKKCPILQFLIRELNTPGFTVKKIVILPGECVGTIRYEIETLVKYCDVVITIGCVQNGLIYKVLSEIVRQPLEANSKLLEAKTCCHTEITIPVSAKVIRGHDGIYPLVHLQRIYVLHDLFEILQSTYLDILKPILHQYRLEKHFNGIAIITLNGNSSNFNTQNHLEELVSDKSPDITIKSVTKESHELLVEFSSKNLSDLVAFENKIKEQFTCGIEFDHPDNTWEEIYSSSNPQIHQSIKAIEDCLAHYGPEKVFLSFNGGKDCTVLLHLIMVVMKKHYPQYVASILCVYVQSQDPFPEQDDFINLCRQYYNLEITLIRGGIKEALQQILEKQPKYKACFMGTRRTDPYSSDLQIFQMTDSNWPQIMRVSPLLNWHYSDIWDYLLYYKIPYCTLYDLGFTSLGNTVNTIKNPSLIYYDVTEEKELYLPAYKLLRETNERHGRDVS